MFWSQCYVITEPGEKKGLKDCSKLSPLELNVFWGACFYYRNRMEECFVTQAVLKGGSGWTCQVVFMPTTSLMLCWGKHRDLRWRWWSWAVCTAQRGSWAHFLFCYDFSTWLIFQPLIEMPGQDHVVIKGLVVSIPGSAGHLVGVFLHAKKNIDGAKIIFRLRCCRGTEAPGSRARHPARLAGPMGMTPLPCPDVPLSGWGTHTLHLLRIAGGESKVSQSKVNWRGFYGSILAFPSFSMTTITISSLVVMFSAAL